MALAGVVVNVQVRSGGEGVIKMIRVKLLKVMMMMMLLKMVLEMMIEVTVVG